MISWVAVDVLGGRAVRLTKGREEARTDYGAAGEQLMAWADRGAAHLHVVDLDAALGRPPALVPLLRSARRKGLKAAVQVAGGIRSEGHAQRLAEAGADRFVLGSLLFSDPGQAATVVRRFGPERCVAALDVRGRTVRASGWLRDTGLTLEQAFRLASESGFKEALVTDIDRDGTLRGADLCLFESLRGFGISAIASGGIARRDEVAALSDMPWVSGAVVGKALYDGVLDLPDLDGAKP